MCGEHSGGYYNEWSYDTCSTRSVECFVKHQCLSSWELLKYVHRAMDNIRKYLLGTSPESLPVLYGRGAEFDHEEEQIQGDSHGYLESLNCLRMYSFQL